MVICIVARNRNRVRHVSAQLQWCLFVSARLLAEAPGADVACDGAVIVGAVAAAEAVALPLLLASSVSTLFITCLLASWCGAIGSGSSFCLLLQHVQGLSWFINGGYCDVIGDQKKEES